jgi:predicted aspartyl protease
MGKVIEKIKLTNIFDPSKVVEIDAVIDSGATMLALPQDVIEQLALQKDRKVRVRYANNHSEDKSIYGVAEVELLGRKGSFDVLAEPVGAISVVGYIVLAILDLLIDPKSGKLIPNPASPEIPMMELLWV